MTSVVDIVSAISNEIGLLIFKAVALSENYDSNILIKKFRLTNRQFYPTMKGLMDVGLVKRINGKYRLTIFGKVVFSALAKAEIAVEIHWKLKAIDSLEDLDDLPAEEHKKLINELIDNQEIKAILASNTDNNNNNKIDSVQPLLGIEQQKTRKQTHEKNKKGKGEEHQREQQTRSSENGFEH
jgi:hypothetical protein